LEEWHQRLPIDNRSHAAVHDRIPDHAGKERGNGWTFVDDGRGSRGRSDDDFLELKQVEAVVCEREEVRMVANLRQLRLSEQFDGGQPCELRERDLDWLDGAREIRDAEDRLLPLATHLRDQLCA